MYKSQKIFQKWQHKPANGITNQKPYFEINFTENGSCVEWNLHETAGTILLPVGSWPSTEVCAAELTLAKAVSSCSPKGNVHEGSLDTAQPNGWEQSVLRAPFILVKSWGENKWNNQPHETPASLGCPRFTLRMSIHNLPDSQPGSTMSPAPLWLGTPPQMLWLLHCQGCCQELVWHPGKEGAGLQCSQGTIQLPVRPWQYRLYLSYLPHSALAVVHLSGQEGRGQAGAMVCARRIDTTSGPPYDHEKPLPLCMGGEWPGSP